MQLDRDYALQRLLQALEIARSAGSVPDEWLKRATLVGEAGSKTFTPFLGTALLARATDERIDALAIKEDSSENAYSARSLAHKVLVPASVEHGFDLRTTGREPLNNQPFFRYDRVDAIDRVLSTAEESLGYLIESLQRVNQLSSEEALNGLAAFLRVRLSAADSAMHSDLSEVRLGLRSILNAATVFVREEANGGRRAQALVAAAFDLAYPACVETRRVNDPSRHYPGDVQVIVDGEVVLAAEARGKAVTDTDVLLFARALKDAGVGRGAVAAFAPNQSPLHHRDLASKALDLYGVLIRIFDLVDEFLLSALAWSPSPLPPLLARFPQLMVERLEEMEARPQSVSSWMSLCYRSAKGSSSS